MTAGDGTDGRSGWCGRGAHHRCVGEYDVRCGCVCHEYQVDARSIGLEAAADRLLAGGAITVGGALLQWSEVLQLLTVARPGLQVQELTLEGFGDALAAVRGSAGG